MAIAQRSSHFVAIAESEPNRLNLKFQKYHIPIYTGINSTCNELEEIKKTKKYFLISHDGDNSI
jgi:hypothetical protein